MVMCAPFAPGKRLIGRAGRKSAFSGATLAASKLMSCASHSKHAGPAHQVRAAALVRVPAAQDVFGDLIPKSVFLCRGLGRHPASDRRLNGAHLLDGCRPCKPVSRQHWKVIYADSEELDAANNVATNVFDLQESTFWHTNYASAKTPHPHQLVIDLGEDKRITGFSYLPRAEANHPGMIKDYKVYIKSNPFQLK